MAPFNAKRAISLLRGITRLPLVVATAVDDREGGVFIDVGYDMAVEDAEYVAATILRDLLRQESQDPDHCDACRRRFARIRDAVAMLERDGARPTGQVRGETH